MSQSAPQALTSQTPSDAALQREYYAQTAERYNAMHLHEDEHRLALGVLAGILDFVGARSVLDVGSGTGRAVHYLKEARPGLHVRGIEPVRELREIAYAGGLSRQDITDGDALALDFADGEFDLVCEFGVLHHIRTPEKAVAEMLRVSSKAIFLSDSNNFGQGHLLMRSIKQLLHAVRLWPLANLIKTRGRGYSVTEGDGLAFSYSVFDNYAQISEACMSVHLLNTKPARPNLYRSAGSVALLGIKRRGTPDVGRAGSHPA